MKVKEFITIDRVENASTGSATSLVHLEKLALMDVSYAPPAPLPIFGAPSTKHFTFQAIEAGKAKIQFATYRPWMLSEANYEDPIVFDVEEAETEAVGAEPPLNPGGWTPFTTVTEESRKHFDEALKGFSSTGFKPFAVTSQVATGTCYIFAANAKPVYPDSHEYPALVRVFKPLHGPAYTNGIKALGSSQAYLGGWGPFHETSSEEKAVLKKAFEGFAGAGYEALVASAQLVEGLNLRFIGTQTLITRDAGKSPVLFTVHAPPKGNPVFTGEQKVYDLV